LGHAALFFLVTAAKATRRPIDGGKSTALASVGAAVAGTTFTCRAAVAALCGRATAVTANAG
jgi:hypothetical protein